MRKDKRVQGEIGNENKRSNEKRKRRRCIRKRKEKRGKRNYKMK